MKKKFKFPLGSGVKHKLTKGNLFVIGRYEREHICGVKDIQYLVRNEKFEVHEVSEKEIY